ncbi:MAG: Vitamin dependent methionine synthase, activation domain protein [Bacteroidetes bacterium]|nr:Vitamin dependent methionine synthase, activation domain protein [Bacteroidota bacterium]
MLKANFQFDFSDLKIDITQIEKVMGYKEGESHETISELVKKVLQEAETDFRIRAEYAVFPVAKFNETEKSVEINNLVFNLRKIVYGQIKKSDSIAVFLCTAGEETGIRSRRAMKNGDLLTGYIYDVIGSEIAEAAADLMQDNLREAMASGGKKITNRYSPGYCGWDVSEQHKLFQLMPDNFCGIQLNTSALMDPEKSISGFIGIGEYVKYNQYTCGLCEMKDCIYRKTKSSK